MQPDQPTPDRYGLGELIDRLAAEPDQDRHVPIGFTYPHSYRGDYMDLAFEVAYDVPIREMLADARSALGSTFQGWKGGYYTMGQHTDVWLVTEEGTSNGESLGAIMLSLLLAQPADVDAAYERGKAEQAAEVERLQALLDHAEQYARDLQDDGVVVSPADVAILRKLLMSLPYWPTEAFAALARIEGVEPVEPDTEAPDA